MHRPILLASAVLFGASLSAQNYLYLPASQAPATSELRLGTLYLVATPIGNLEDVTRRAARVLGEVDRVLAEDTRRTRVLLDHLGVSVRVVAVHEHNEAERTGQVLDWLEAGEALALVSDAGTPLVSDPGARVVRAAADAGHDVIPIPGPSAVLAALIASGLPTDRFTFLGFPPRRAGDRRLVLGHPGRLTDRGKYTAGVDFERWAWAGQDRYPGFCLTLVNERTPQTVAEALGAGTLSVMTLAEAEHHFPISSPGTLLRLGTSGNWTFCFEDRAPIANREPAIARLSAGTRLLQVTKSGDGMTVMRNVVDGQQHRGHAMEARKARNLPRRPLSIGPRMGGTESGHRAAHR